VKSVFPVFSDDVKTKMANFDEGGKFEDATAKYLEQHEDFFFNETDFINVEGEPEGDAAFDGDFTLV
jgi:hypothetical protein